MNQFTQAVDTLRQGGVIAYPTEYCFGLGCDPANVSAIQRILAIKQRKAQQGLILIAANIDQIVTYVHLLDAPEYDRITDSWPGPYTWLIKAKKEVSEWVRGHHKTVAVRVTEHPQSKAICEQFGGAIISTSANRHGAPELLTHEQVNREMGTEVDYIVEGLVGGAEQPSQILDGQTGERLR